ncbi:DMT family transporter [Paracoccaceae bacterium GXU_MW_L88]
MTLTHLHRPRRGAALMIGAGALFALANTAVQYAVMSQSVSAPSVAFWQYGIALLAMLPTLRGFSALKTQHPLSHILRVALSAAGIQLWVMGLAYVPIWQAIALVMLSPFFVTIGASVWLGEALTLPRIVAVITGFVGGMVILAPWSESFDLHALYPVGAAVFWAGVSLLTKKLGARDSAQTLTLYLLLLLTPFNAIVALPSGFALPLGLTGATVLGAGLATALAQFMLARAYQIADASYLQPFDHLKLPLNVALGVLAFGFIPPGTLWLGALLIVGASFALYQIETLQVKARA